MNILIDWDMSREKKMADTLKARPGQTLADHLEGVARRTEAFASKFGAGEWGRVLGLLHDAGKASQAFQDRLEGSGERVDHSTAGARILASTFPLNFGWPMAYCAAGHHGGLPDGKSADESCLLNRLNPERRTIEDFSGFKDCIDAAALACPASPRFPESGNSAGFRQAFFTRMLFSCLVDADRLDAEAAGNPEDAVRRGRAPSLDVLLDRLDRYTGNFKPDSPVNVIRAGVLKACRDAADLTPGLFSLTVPTGGSKTLSALTFSMRHAVSHCLDRVIYVAPFTSIIEQNADVFRSALGDVDGEIVVEHHCNVEPPAERDGRAHPATENWDAPLVVTTAVQFFESLFGSRAGQCRKLHNIARSVVLLDEAQAIPLHVLRPCLDALRELCGAYGATVVLCTATQPALNAPVNGGDGLKRGFVGVREIIPDPVGLHESLNGRVNISHLGILDLDALVRRVSAEPQNLCILNSREDARRLFGWLRFSGVAAIHLSALMTPEHRAGIIAAIKPALAQGNTCRVVSTSLVEAGVDLDFPVVLRAESGLDSVAQAAGRCNREGKRERGGRVGIFRLIDGAAGGDGWNAEALRSVISRHLGDLLHPKALRDYFLELYWRAGDADLDRNNILGGLVHNLNKCLINYRTTSMAMRLIEDGSHGIIIPRTQAARDAVAELEMLHDGDRAGTIIRRLQRHMVSVYEKNLQMLEKVGAVQPVGPDGQFRVLKNMDWYRDDVGLDVFRDVSGIDGPENKGD